jgi:hypothetical protein
LFAHAFKAAINNVALNTDLFNFIDKGEEGATLEDRMYRNSRLRQESEARTFAMLPTLDPGVRNNRSSSTDSLEERWTRREGDRIDALGVCCIR